MVNAFARTQLLLADSLSIYIVNKCNRTVEVTTNQLCKVEVAYFEIRCIQDHSGIVCDLPRRRYANSKQVFLTYLGLLNGLRNTCAHPFNHAGLIARFHQLPFSMLSH